MSQWFDASGGNGTATVTTTAGCACMVTGTPSWVTFTSGAAAQAVGVQLTVEGQITIVVRIALC